jgi:alkanesulfonate monooxygenase SsuD/methylene tetrahydromethanopterin reductase-like flavin-dependent oxidoreductase (luciferase family)
MNILFSLIYDLRNPPQWRLPFDEFYRKFLDQVAWADAHGFDSVLLSEHHFEDDGFLPSPLVLGAAIAARTTKIRIAPMVTLLSLRHPVQFAEEAALVDIISGGRLDLTVGAGHHDAEFEGYGIPKRERAGRMEEALQIVKMCWEKEEFDFEGRYWQLRNVRMTPKPVQRPRPRIVLGGNSEGAAHRAARHADGFAPSGAQWLEPYHDELDRLGKQPGSPFPRATQPFFLHVARDPDAAWRRIAPHALYEWNEYSRYRVNNPNTSFKLIEDADWLRSNGIYTVLTPEETVALGIERQKTDGTNAVLGFRPLSGGLPFDLAQESLDLVISDVMPQFLAEHHSA